MASSSWTRKAALFLQSRSILLLLLAVSCQSTELQVVAGRAFRFDLAVELNRTLSELVHAELRQPLRPSSPSFINITTSLPLIAYGSAPSQAQTLELRLILVRASRDVEEVALTLDVLEGEASGNRWALALTNKNATSLATEGSTWEQLLAATRQMSASLQDATSASELFVHNVTNVEGRNLPPSAYDPPVFPNAYLSSSAVVVFESRTRVLTCEELEAAAGTAFSSRDLELDFGTCRSISIASSTSRQVDLSGLSPLSRSHWKRTRKPFDNSVVPCVVVASILLLICIVYAIIHCVQKSDLEELLLQRSRLIQNRLHRHRAHVFRQGRDGPYGPMVVSQGSTEFALSSPQRRTRVQEPPVERVPPPSYRMPPKHDFSRE